MNIKKVSQLTLLIPFFIIALLSVQISISKTVSAVSAGCYFGEGNGTNTYAPTTCPTEGYARAAGQYQACFVVLPSGAVEERNCSMLESTASKVPASSSTGNSANNPPVDSKIEPDCTAAILNSGNCDIIKYLVISINFLAALAGIAIVASFMIAGFTYMTAQDNAGQTQKSKSRIFQTIIALTLFIFMYAFLNFIIPGGLGIR